MSVLVLSGGALVPTMMDAPNAYYAGYDNLWTITEGSDSQTLYRTQRSIRTVVGFLARNVAQVQLHAFQLEPGGDRDRLDRQHPLSRMLAPRPQAARTPYREMYDLIVDLSLYDRWAAAKIRNGSGGVELVRLDPATWRFVRHGATKQPLLIRLYNNGETMDIPLDAAVWLDGYPLGGADASPIETLRSLLAEEKTAGEYRTKLWANDARIGGWIERPLDSPPWSATARDNFRAGWSAAYTSTGTRAGGTPILEEGMKYNKVDSVTPQEAQQIEARKLTTSEVAAAYHVPPVLVGVLDNANYSNVSAYRQILYSDTLGPLFTDIQQAFQSRLVPDLADPDTVFVEFNVAEKLKMSFEEQAGIFQTATGAPFMTRNEARRRVNLPAIDGADELIVPLNVLEGGQASPTDISPTAAGISDAAPKGAEA